MLVHVNFRTSVIQARYPGGVPRSSPSDARHQFDRAPRAYLEVWGGRRRSAPFGLRRDLHGSVKQIQHEDLDDADEERSSKFSGIMLKQADSRIQHLYAARERAQDQQRGHR